ncbi:MAG: 2-amino-4-hydroxy-6-hydroxymethyldihydropteridine pyrophosphokinae [Spartobacteria bacterium]|nr:2-amino-4-hydroxy-6-hydroxymethyldihydropteridine pyrophosphokinae [Spartobacteria bacterium]
MKAGVALGSNLGDRFSYLRAARKGIAALEGVVLPILASPIYETDPIDCEPGATNFLNAVVEFTYQGEVLELFDKLKQLEIAFGRPSSHKRNVSRPIDADLLYFGDMTLKSERLTLPHPRIEGRKFVLAPLADIRPELVLPGQTDTIRELLASLPQSGKVVRLTHEWDAP